QWRSFERNSAHAKPVTIGTVFHYALQFGWGDSKSGGAEPQRSGPLFDPWAQYIVPTFPLDVFPAVTKEFVASQSIVIGCDPSALAMTVLGTFSGALDHRFALKMLRHGQWWEHPCLWVLLVGDPSAKKTPAMNAATRPLEMHQKYMRERAEAEWKEHLEHGGD